MHCRTWTSVVVLALLCCAAIPASAIDLEAGVVKPIAPDLTTTIGLNLGVGLGTFPVNVPVASDLIGGHKMFADFLWINSHPALGWSFATDVEDKDHIRIGFSVWRADAFEWSVYLRNGVCWTW